MGLSGLRQVGSPRTRGRTHVSCIGRRILSHWTTREASVLQVLTNAPGCVPSRVVRGEAPSSPRCPLRPLRGNPSPTPTPSNHSSVIALSYFASSRTLRERTCTAFGVRSLSYIQGSGGSCPLGTRTAPSPGGILWTDGRGHRRTSRMTPILFPVWGDRK